MSTNEVFQRGGGLVLRLAVPSGIVSGDPVQIGHLHGVAETTRDTAGYASVYIPYNAVYDLTVEAKDGAGNSAVAVGDRLYYDTAETIKINKDFDNGRPFGIALEAVTSGASAVIRVALVDTFADANIAADETTVVADSAAIAIPTANNTYFITKAGVAALTIVDPTAGTHDGRELTFISATAQAHTLSNAAGSGFNAGGAGSDIGTFGGAIGDNITIVAYNGKWLVKDKTNVTLA